MLEVPPPKPEDLELDLPAHSRLLSRLTTSLLRRDQPLELGLRECVDLAQLLEVAQSAIRRALHAEAELERQRERSGPQQLGPGEVL